ncbi:MAG TPA: hypothetical protein VGS62_00655 [Streptosporangiaceae bacterium]|nr:hypothetical protein [Streptosporangiaceae bacterium]
MVTNRIAGKGGRTRSMAAMALASAVAVSGASGAQAAASPAPDAAGTITTVAGGVGGPGPATRVAVALPRGVSFAHGQLYISQGHVRDVSAATGRLTTPAGQINIPGAPVSDGGPAVAANLGARSTVTDSAGNLVIADEGNNRIRVLAARTGVFYGQQMTAGDIYTVAGDGTQGYSGDGGPATSAELNLLGPVTADGRGNLVIADTGNNRLRVVAVRTGVFYGQQMTAGDIYTVAGDGTAGSTGDGGPATSAEINGPEGVVVDQTGNLLLSDGGPSSLSGRIRVVAVSTGTFYGQQMTAGDIYTILANLYGPEGLALDGHGNLVIAEFDFNEILVYAASTGTFYGQQMTAGHAYRVAGGGTGQHGLGDGGPALRAVLYWPASVALDSAGNLIIADTFHSRVRVVAESSGSFYGQQMITGDIYTVAGNGTEGSSGYGGPATKAEIGLGGVALDHAGNLLVSDGVNGASLLRVVPPVSGTFYGQQMTAGDIYTIAGGGGSYPGDGGPATSGELGSPAGLVVDSSGNLLIADQGGNRIRMVAERTGTFYTQQMTAGDIYTVAGNGQYYFRGDGGPATLAQIASPAAVAVDGAGNLVLTDTVNNRVRVVAASTGTFYGQQMTAGYIYTVAGDGRIIFNGNGKPATQSSIYRPRGVAVDSHGNLVIADSGHNRVRVVAASAGTFYGRSMTAGDMYTVAGTGTAGFAGDGGAATQAEMSLPAGIAIDAAGNLLVADVLNGRVRVVAEKTGIFYGQPMTAGHIYTVAGGGTSGLGDGGPATSAELGPLGVAAGSQGSLLIADVSTARVRQVSG